MAEGSDNKASSAPCRARKVVWIQNKGKNTGGDGELADMIGSIERGLAKPSDPQGILVEHAASQEQLEKFVKDKQWVQYDCPLANFLYGKPTIKV
eukprot:scaffold807_cov49-Prasinocladus_malaysianus.AAC.2